MADYRSRKILYAAVMLAAFAFGPAAAQVSSSGSVNGINYVVVGGGSQSIQGSDGGLEVVSDGVRILVTPDTIDVDGTLYDVAAFDEVRIDQTGGGLHISVDGREVLSMSMVDDLTARADNGDVEAMNRLSILLFEGDGVPADPVRAEKLLRAAALAGNPHAQSNLANRLGFGLGLAENHAEAFEWAVRSAEQQHPFGQYTAAKMLIYGIGTVVDADRAVAYFESAVDLGIGEAAAELGYIFAGGIEVASDAARAADYYRMGIELGSARAAHNLAVLAVETEGTTATTIEGLAALDDAISMGWSEDTTELRALLENMSPLPDARFFYAEGQTPIGPITLDQLRGVLAENTITPQTLAWEGGTDNWVTTADLLARQN